MHFLITAGPTREPLDPVRFLSNRSSGRMGFALAAAAVAAGHDVALIAGPVSLATPAGVIRVDVTTAQEMFDAVARLIPAADAAVFCAAVTDFRPVRTSSQKIKKSGAPMTLTLEPTPDILGSVRGEFQWNGYLVGFAAETENVLSNAREKLYRKGCDLIVANDVSGAETGFESGENEATLIYPDGTVRTLPRMSKEKLAAIIIGSVPLLQGC